MTGAGTVNVGVDVTNTGSRAGTEVAQVYVAQPAGVGEPSLQANTVSVGASSTDLGLTGQVSIGGGLVTTPPTTNLAPGRPRCGDPRRPRAADPAPSTAWGARTKALSALGSTDGTNFTTLVPSTGYSFDSATGTPPP